MPQTASWLFWVTPVVAFTCMLTVPILIPVLTNFPLPLSDMGDILGGGLILTLGSFMIILAGLDTSSAYGGIGSSRAVMVSILAEPTLILVFVGITLLAKAMLPFVVNHLLVVELGGLFQPGASVSRRGLLHSAARRDRPHADPFEHAYRGLYDRRGRILEYSGPLLALLKWASAMKQFILYTIFCNVLVLPWGLSHQGHGARRARGRGVASSSSSSSSPVVVVFVETAQSRLRFYRYQEPLAASFLLGGAGDRRNAVELGHAHPASRSARLFAVQPAGDRQPSCCLS